MTYYDVLGVEADASPATVRRAYLSLARRHHPDSHHADGADVRAANERTMQAINEAWAVLSDPAARRRYDLGLGVGEREQRGAHDKTSHDKAAHEAWHPFDDIDDDELDPRLYDDAPGRRAPSRTQRWLSVAPALCFVVGMALVAVGFVTGLVPAVVLGAAGLTVSVVLFVVAPLVALSASARNDRR